jgi:hypothetical protein
MAKKKTTQPEQATKKANAAPTPKATKAKKDDRHKKLSALDAAAKVLGESKDPMNCQEMIAAMAAKGYWNSPGGQTPHATLYSAILREVKAKGKEARFAKSERGKFTLQG